jgi:hypothetical protein
MNYVSKNAKKRERERERERDKPRILAQRMQMH